jgi:lipopolysaccharide/colanic/teichoic acid biosynthesis glycosyltransferase
MPASPDSEAGPLFVTLPDERESYLALCTDPCPLWKRGMDLGIVVFLLPVVLPLVAAVALWIRLTSRGGVIFRQERIGHGGVPFTIFKFRSMVQDAACEAHEGHVRDLVRSGSPLTKLDSMGDERLILGGCFLRAVGLDELPQLWNVLRGDMSLVGPRPCITAELDLFSKSQLARFKVQPGLTGLWQVNGKNRTTFGEMAALDVRYTRARSVSTDLDILFRTPAAIISQVVDCLKMCVQGRRKNQREDDDSAS